MLPTLSHRLKMTSPGAYFANGEIAGHRIYGHTGVLTVFTGPRGTD